MLRRLTPRIMSTTINLINSSRIRNFSKRHKIMISQVQLPTRRTFRTFNQFLINLFKGLTTTRRQMRTLSNTSSRTHNLVRLITNRILSSMFLTRLMIISKKSMLIRLLLNLTTRITTIRRRRRTPHANRLSRPMSRTSNNRNLTKTNNRLSRHTQLTLNRTNLRIPSNNSLHEPRLILNPFNSRQQRILRTNRRNSNRTNTHIRNN